MQQLPPLSSLRVFRSAAHHLSFTLAAEELFVTQAAVSHQIKSLEEFLGLKLFERFNRALKLTNAGKQYLPYIDQIFTTLMEGTESILEEGKTNSLTVSVLPSFAVRWLVPRLGLFMRENPEIDLRLAPSRNLVDFQKDNIDISIRYGSSFYQGLTTVHLLDEDIYPVCCPALMEGPNPLNCPGDLKYHPLLHDDGHGDWRAWLLAANVHDVDVNKGPVYTDSSMSVQSAIEGHGVALARSQLVKDDIARGLLVKPFDIVQPSRFAYYIVYPETNLVRSEILLFQDWLLRQAAEVKHS